MSAITITKALMDAEKQQPIGQHYQQPRYHQQPLLKEPTQPAELVSKSSLSLAASTQHTQQVSTKIAPKLTIPRTKSIQPTDSATSSTVSSPTSSASSFSGMDQHDAVTFSFSSPLFYDQKLYIYHSLLKLYQLLARCTETHPAVLMILQYSIAIIHGLTVYILSVILSVAQLIMIAFTLENLDWIQSYKPLMCEWDRRFPGFVFPALDIESESEGEDAEDPLVPFHGHKGKLYWASKTILATGGDLTDGGCQSEENQKRLAIKQSMNSILHRRLSKYQQWIPIIWSAEEGSTPEKEIEMGDNGECVSSQDTQVRTISEGPRPSKSKRVTFNEQVHVFGRGRSSQVSQSAVSSPSLLAHNVTQAATNPSTAGAKQEDGTKVAKELTINEASAAGLPTIKENPSTPSLPSVGGDAPDAMTHEETEYQQSTASEDVNGSGSSSPSFQPDSRQTDILPTSSPASPPRSGASFPANLIPASPVNPIIVNEPQDLKRSSSVPLKIHSFLHRHQNSNTKRRSATFSEPRTVSPNPRVTPLQLTEPTGLYAALPASSPSQLGQESDTGFPKNPLSFGTRAKRSLSLALPRHGHHSNAAGTETSDSDNASIDRHGSIGRKNLNFMYRIVHPQRYKRELEDQLSEHERQRLLALAQLQRQCILEADNLPTSSDPVWSDSLAANRNRDTQLYGNAYYYTTQAEYIEGLGAPNSMISTSIGTSFPHELQSKKSKSFLKQSRPASYDFGDQSRPFAGNGSESEILNQSRTPHHLSFFKRDSKKIGAGTQAHSHNCLQQLFSHPGHKQTQSTSSLISPPGAASAAATAAAATNSSPSLEDVGNGHTSPSMPPSPAAASAHPLLSQGRSSPRNFTSFTALAMPANPPAHVTLPLALTSPGMICPSSAVLTSDDPALKHTTFAAFGFPSPNQSPVNSAPASPRHSTSSMPVDMPSSIWAMNDFHRNVMRGEETFNMDHISSGKMERIPQQEYQHQQQGEVSLEGDAFKDTSILQDTESTEDKAAAGNHNLVQDTRDSTAAAAKSSTPRGLNFMHKLSLKRKHKQQ
ncbi:hypothetical protein BC939DRAFT_439279 [Gamsiella multidivaricata]|uniref:uncharacterized protein n=1 Tax=Gamsiella multidivaricata TaxID=101098 RepID=UPI0022206BB6|nr:uncharacterized protein BC939DRAFT_439279 [Gamsiella multidivaricata]KAG0371127.1 hypothetical protein BGZ54_010101 [Gamsiella multidivaricata]KAI7830424.1 hypothetical protein BC939DRAFT_439279 [Gamsiella multidivaricata]